MAIFEIVKVRTMRPYGAAHEHITHVMLPSGSTLTKETVIRDILSPYGDRYYTWGGGVRADVIVRRCPYCTAHDYITTTPDYTIANNLLSLPRF